MCAHVCKKSLGKCFLFNDFMRYPVSVYSGCVQHTYKALMLRIVRGINYHCVVAAVETLPSRVPL